ncbi:hypothetical protein [Rufibacter sp. LB8]|uniref:hypothetical protein n=1 Tax=Rufibacter sp. LB8 TaxID=2777781 RepID=UPI00178C70A9|nr:hypothetical protein [Rufibacter sp. LB8]
MKSIFLLFFVAATLFGQSCKTSSQATTTSVPVDPKATAIAQEVLAALGGRKAWEDTRFIAWTFNNQYHIWDKKTNDLRYERGDSLVVLSNLSTRQGQVFLRGTQVTDTTRASPLIRRMYPMWANNSYWLLMPYKILDPGVTLRYKGDGTTQAGAPADMLEMTFSQVGVTPDNKYLLAVDKKSRLITEWSYFAKYTDEKPNFTRPWTNYQKYGKLLLSSGRSTDPNDRLNIKDIHAAATLDPALFTQKTVVDRQAIWK